MNILKIVGIVASVILGAFAGRFACGVMNKKEFTVNPMICTIAGIVGGALGSWLVGAFGFGQSIKMLLLQIVAGVGFAFMILLFVFLARDKKEDPTAPFEDEDEDEDEEEEESETSNS